MLRPVSAKSTGRVLDWCRASHCPGLYPSRKLPSSARVLPQFVSSLFSLIFSASGEKLYHGRADLRAEHPLQLSGILTLQRKGSAPTAIPCQTTGRRSDTPCVRPFEALPADYICASSPSKSSRLRKKE